MRDRAADFAALGKPRVVLMVLVTTLVGAHLGTRGDVAWSLVLHLMIGTALAAAGTLALNEYLERDIDALMVRTRNRPLPAHRLTPASAAVFGVALVMVGHGYLWAFTNALATVVTAAITITYLGVYTPLKRVSSLCSIVGAVPGALPPVTGWVAVRGELGVEPIILFAIMFLWQIPHTLAIGSLYRDDYSRAGIRVLPVLDETGWSTAVHSATNCLALLPVTLLPTLLGMSGRLYFLVAMVLGAAFLWTAIDLLRESSRAHARRLMFASLVYLPALLTVMAVDKPLFAP